MPSWRWLYTVLLVAAPGAAQDDPDPGLPTLAAADGAPGAQETNPEDVSLTTRLCIENVRLQMCQSPIPTKPEALRSMRKHWMYFVGESNLRQMYYQYEGLGLGVPWDIVEDHKDKPEDTLRVLEGRLTFSYQPYYRNMTAFIRDTMENGEPYSFHDPNKGGIGYGQHPSVYIFSAGLHDILYDFDDAAGHRQEFLDALKAFNEKFGKPVLYRQMQPLMEQNLTKHRAAASQFRNTNVNQFNEAIKSEVASWVAEQDNNTVFLMDQWVTSEIPTNCEFDGVHSMRRAREEAEGLTSAMWFLNNDPALLKKQPSAGVLMFFVALIFVALVTASGELGLILSWLHQKRGSNSARYSSIAMDELGDERNAEGEAPDEDEEPIEPEIIAPLCCPSVVGGVLQIYKNGQEVWRHALKFFLVVLVVYLFDGPWTAFDPDNKMESFDFFLLFHIIVLAVAYMTMKPVFRNQDKVLSRDQTEEWKGIMQIAFVMYHYFHTEQAYNAIRIFIACYVWMTGFGNTAYFLIKKDYSFSRVGYMMVRLNWLVFWVCLVLQEDVMLYYICPLHTLFFYVAYFTNAVWQSTNPTLLDAETGKWDYSGWKGYVAKLAAAFGILFMIFDIPGVWDVAWGYWYWLLGIDGSMHEWWFRSTLDHYDTWVGVVMAFAYPFLNDFIQGLDKLSKGKATAMRVGIIGFVCAGVYYWWNTWFLLPKRQYNAIHPYTFWIPLVSYVVLRNIFKTWRQWASAFLGWMGKITLETYIFQYHIYMMYNAKATIVLLKGWPYVNLALITVIYVACSKIAFDSTQNFALFLIPRGTPSGKGAIRFFTMTFVVGALYGVCVMITQTIPP